MKSIFRVAVINDEISQDFGHACEVTSKEFGMDWIELRGMWNKNILKLDANEIAEARRIGSRRIRSRRTVGRGIGAALEPGEQAAQATRPASRGLLA